MSPRHCTATMRKPQLLLSISMETICHPCRHFSVRLTPRTLWGWQVDSNSDQRWGCRVYKPSRCFFLPDRYKFPIPAAQSSRNVFFSAQAVAKTLTVLCIFPKHRYFTKLFLSGYTFQDVCSTQFAIQTLKRLPPSAIPGIDIEYLRSDRCLTATENIHAGRKPARTSFKRQIFAADYRGRRF